MRMELFFILFEKVIKHFKNTNSVLRICKSLLGFTPLQSSYSDNSWVLHLPAV